MSRDIEEKAAMMELVIAAAAEPPVFCSSPFGRRGIIVAVKPELTVARIFESGPISPTFRKGFVRAPHLTRYASLCGDPLRDDQY